MKILSLLKSKTNAAASSSAPSTSGSVRVIGGDNTTVDGQTINPAIVNAGIVNASEINSNNINNTNNITTNTLNANYVTADTLRATTLSSQLINAGTINATEHSTFQDGITAYHDSTLQNIISESIENSGLITTKDLEVTGSAHFFELIIDKIKAAGGSVLITPADGFTIDDATLETMNVRAGSYSYQPVSQLCPVLWFRAEDGDRTITNMWQPYDQAICANFNEVKEGRSTDVSNNYWWWMVGATDNDNLGGDVDTITSYTYTYYPVNDYTSYSYTSYSYTSSATTGYGGAILHPIYNRHGEYIDTVPCHYIALVAQNIDQETGDMDIKDSSSANLLDINVLKKQIGNDVAMLGHNWRDTRTILDTTNRRSAIYMSCYTNWLDTGLRPPLFAHYRGINNFGPLSSKRFTKFDALGGEIIGEFKVQAAGTSTTTDLDDYILGTVGQTEYELSCTANNDNSQLEIIVLQADENSNIHDMNNFPAVLKIGVLHNGSFVAANKYSSLEVAVFGVTYDLLNFTSPTGSGILPTSVTWNSTSYTYDMAFAYSGTGDMQVANSSIEISGTISDGGQTYNVYKGIQMPVITSIEGTDADLYMLSPVDENAIVDANGTLNANLKYYLKHCVGTTVTYETTAQGHTCNVLIYNEANAYMSTVQPVFSNNAWSFTDSQSNWYNQTTQDKKYIYRVELVDSNSIVVDNRVIVVNNEPTALFSVTQGLTQSIQANTTAIQSAQGDITTLQGDYSSISQTVNGIQTTVASHTTDISNINGDITNINTSMSTIDQKANHISAYVEYVDGTTTGTLPGKLKTTGIDIGQGTITLNADNTVINGSLDIYDDNCGLTLYNSDGQIKTQIVTRNVSSISNNNFIHVCTTSGRILNNTVTLTYNLGLINTGTSISIDQQSIEVTDDITTTLHPAGDYTVSIIDENDNVLVTNSITNTQIENGGCDIANYTFSGSNQQLRLQLSATLGNRENWKLTWQFTETVTADAYNIIGRDGMLITNTKNRMFRIDNNEMTIQSNDDAISFIPRNSGDTQTPILRRGWNGNSEFWMPYDNYERTIRLVDVGSAVHYNDRELARGGSYNINYNEAGTYIFSVHAGAATTYNIYLPSSGSFMSIPGYKVKIVYNGWCSKTSLGVAKHTLGINVASGSSDTILHGTSYESRVNTNNFKVNEFMWTGDSWVDTNELT